MSVSGLPNVSQILPGLSGISGAAGISGSGISGLGISSPVFPNGLTGVTSQSTASSSAGSASDPLLQQGLAAMSPDTQALFLGIQAMMVSVLAVVAAALQSVASSLSSGGSGSSSASSLPSSMSTGGTSDGSTGDSGDSGGSSSGTTGGSGSGSVAQGSKITANDIGSITDAKGNLPANAQTIYNFLRSQGLSPNAAAGVTGNIFGESGGNPESQGSGGNGLIGWTPPLQGAVTGDSKKDLAFQLNAVMDYINKNGSVDDLNKHADSAADAAKYFCYNYERPLDPAGDSPKREDSASAVLAAFGA